MLPYSESTAKQLKQDFPDYLAFGTIVDRNVTIANIANNLLSSNNDQQELLLALRQWLNDYVYDENKKLIRNARSLLESRLTPATKVLENHMGSCGALVTLGAAILRSINIPVKLIHGTFGPNLIDHAWIEIYFPESNAWQPFDFTGKGEAGSGNITHSHHKLAECADWSYIRNLLEKEHRHNIVDKNL